MWPKILSSDKFAFFIFFISCLLILFLSSLILVSWGKLPPEIPLFYSRPWGGEMLASPIILWILPVISAFVVVVNFFLCPILVSGNRFLTRTLLVFALLVVLASVYTGTKIISLLT